MILKRVEKDDKIKGIYESSNILASSYETSTKDLTIIFKRGVSYTYKNVDKTDFFRFETADSQGQILNSYIKKYQSTKNESVDVDKILKEIENLKNEEIFSFQSELISHMKSIVDIYDKVNSVKNSDIDTLNNLLIKYKELIK